MKNNYWSYFKQNWSNSRPFQIATGIWLLFLILTLLSLRFNEALFTIEEI